MSFAMLGKSEHVMANLGKIGPSINLTSSENDQIIP